MEPYTALTPGQFNNATPLPTTPTGLSNISTPPAGTNNPPAPTKPQGTPTPQPTTPPQSTGLPDTTFLGLLNNMNQGFQQNNEYVKQKNAVVNAMLGGQVDPKTLSTLPKNIQDIIQGGDRNQLMLQAQVLNDQISGYGRGISSSIQYLTTGYQQAQTQYNSDVTNVLNYAKALNQKPSDVMKALYPNVINEMSTEQLSELDKLGAPLLTSTQVARGGIEGITIPEGTIAARTNNPLNIKYSPTSATELGGTDSGIAGQDGGTFASFASPQDGLQAAMTLLQSSTYSGLSVDEAMRKWSNNGYGGEVTEVDKNKKVGSLDDNEIAQLVSDMAKRESGSTLTYGQSDIQDIAHGIEKGTIPPLLTRLYGKASQVMGQLARDGFDLSKASNDWTAMQKRIATMNSAQQVRLLQAINFAYDSLDIISQLNNTWKGSGFPLFNKAELLAFSNGVGNAPLPQPLTISAPSTDGSSKSVTIKDKQGLATLLMAQINDLTSELGTVYKGGNTSTDESLRLAAGNLNADWSYETLNSAVDLAKVNMQIRKNSINTSEVIQGNPYSATSPETTGTTNSNDPLGIR